MALDYDTVASEYALHRRVHPEVLRALVETGGLTSASRVLEVGCGTGNYLLAIRELAACACFGVDPSREMLAHAAARSSEITLRQGSAERLQLPSGSFDLVFTVDVIHHLEDRPAFFREALRVLAQDGKVCTATDSEDDIARRRPLASHFPETIAADRARYPALATLHRELEQAGLSVTAQQAVAYEWAVTDLRPYRDRAFSVLHLIGEEAFERGLARLADDLERGPIPAHAPYTLLWAVAGRPTGWEANGLVAPASPPRRGPDPRPCQSAATGSSL